MENFNIRLIEERERLGLKKGGMARAGGVANSTYTKYEDGSRLPDAAFLSAIAAAGADVQYILTGVRSVKTSTDQYTASERSKQYCVAEPAAQYNIRPDQVALLDNLEHCPKEVQDAIKKLAFVSAKAVDQKEGKRNSG